MNRKDLKPWLPQTYQKDGSVWVEQPDGSFLQCDPFRFKLWRDGIDDTFARAAFAKLTVVE